MATGTFAAASGTWAGGSAAAGAWCLRRWRCSSFLAGRRSVLKSSLTIWWYLHSSLQNGVSPLLFARNGDDRIRTPLRIACIGKAGGMDKAIRPAAGRHEHEPVHEDVAVPGEVLPAEGAGVHGVAAGLALAAAVEWLDAKEGRGGRRSHHFSVLEELSLRVPTRLLHLLKH